MGACNVCVLVSQPVRVCSATHSPNQWTSQLGCRECVVLVPCNACCFQGAPAKLCLCSALEEVQISEFHVFVCVCVCVYVCVSGLCIDSSVSTVWTSSSFCVSGV